MVGAIAYENCHPFSLQDATGRAWTRMPLTTLRVYREGTLVYEGKKHGNIFVDNADDMRRLFLDFAVL